MIPTFFWTIATKYQCLNGNRHQAVKGMNKRLNVETQDLLFIHSPVHPLPLEHWVRAACKAVDLGLASNPNLKLGTAHPNPASHPSIAIKLATSVLAMQHWGRTVGEGENLGWHSTPIISLNPGARSLID